LHAPLDAILSMCLDLLLHGVWGTSGKFVSDEPGVESGHHRDISTNVWLFSMFDGVLEHPCDDTFDERKMVARCLVLKVPVAVLELSAFWTHCIRDEYNGSVPLYPRIFGLFRCAIVIWNRLCIPD